jgi:ubiquinone/menaquinone biosynthesis C-methylase UbiE
MTKIKQKEVFLNEEGDNWYSRNKDYVNQKKMENDFLLKEIITLSPSENQSEKLLEIGCGNGKRLLELKKNNFNVFGIDPSKSAIEEARLNGINALVGTADSLPFVDNSFDVLVFGFCLYLCDREDLFKIASEADRVLKKNGYLYILDFYSKDNSSNNYHHFEGLKSYKMDYSKLFNWHPDYVLIKQILGSHDNISLQTQDKNDWITISVLRKL